MKYLFSFILGLGLSSSTVLANDFLQTWEEYGQNYVYINGLQDDLFKSFILKDSKGPKWQESAQDFLEAEHDLNYASSYWGERIEVGDCGLTEENFDDEFDNAYQEEIKIEWSALKNVKGSKKTLVYVATHITVIQGLPEVCEMMEGEYLFLNDKNKTVEDRYLGIRSLKAQKR